MTLFIQPAENYQVANAFRIYFDVITNFVD